MKKALKVLLILAVLGGAGYFGYQYYQSTQVKAAATTTQEYAAATIGKGNLSKAVTGTGTLSISETQEVALDYAITVKGKISSVGDVVSTGDPMMKVDQELLKTTITTMQTDLDTCESDMATQAQQYTSSSYLKMPLTGRIKASYLEIGRRVEDIMKEKGSIALLSLDGKMYVEVDAPEGMGVTSETVVRLGKKETTGIVRELNDGKAKITFADTFADEGREVEVLFGKQSLGTAPARINVPYLLTTTDKGYISNVYIELNDKKWEGNRVAYLINMPVSEDYKTLEEKRQNLTRQIAEAKAILESGAVPSPIDGIVSVITAPSTTEVAANTSLATLYVGNQKEMVVSVDELDITNVEVGQSATVVMDALQNKVYGGQVTHVSQIGTADSGVTVYDVTISLEGDEQLKIGMNGTATIMVQEVRDTLLVPIAAMNTSRDGQYVWLKDENRAEESDEPGVKTFITTGLSDDSFAQVLTGLSEGDTVLITREADTGNGTRNFMGGGMMMQFGGGAMPAGGGNVVFRNGNGGGGGTVRRGE